MSVERFCMKNKVLYNVFHKCYKDIRNKVVLAQVEGMTTILAIKSETVGVSSGSQECFSWVRFIIDICISEYAFKH